MYKSIILHVYHKMLFTRTKMSHKIAIRDVINPAELIDYIFRSFEAGIANAISSFK